jgi:hypothetical protein
MTLQQLLWAIIALGALVGTIAAVLVTRDRGELREPGMTLMTMCTGLLLCLGGFLLSIPRYRDSAVVAAGATLVGLAAGLLLSARTRRP